MPFPARPFVSFVLATFNRGPILLDCLQKTLAAAQSSLGPDHFNISIVDNASTDQTPALLQSFTAHHPQIKYLRLPKNCGPVAKNAALHNNSADLIVLLDDDAYPLPGSLPQMVRHFQDDPHLGAAVFDVTLPDGRKEASAYPDVCIGAGTALRGPALRSLKNVRPGRGLLPADFFMQAEEYDLSFRLLAHGWSVQRFWDMPLLHLKSPGARITTRTTLLDVRNNLWLLARYLPQPLCEQLAADWLARYWRMAIRRDAESSGSQHRAAFLRGAAAGFAHFAEQRGPGELLLAEDTLEKIFKFTAIRNRLAHAQAHHGLRRIALGDWGKNVHAYYQAARDLNLEITAVIDGNLSGPNVEYHDIPVIPESTFRDQFQPTTDAVIITAMSRVHAQRRAAELRRTLHLPILDLFSPATSVRPTVEASALVAS